MGGDFGWSARAWEAILTGVSPQIAPNRLFSRLRRSVGRDSGWSRAPWDVIFLPKVVVFGVRRGTISSSTCMLSSALVFAGKASLRGQFIGQRGSALSNARGRDGKRVHGHMRPNKRRNAALRQCQRHPGDALLPNALHRVGGASPVCNCGHLRVMLRPLQRYWRGSNLGNVDSAG